MGDKMHQLRWNSAARTDTGRKRKVNEDAVFIGADQALWCVADGMGGHKRGDAASQLVTYRLGKLAAHHQLLDIIEEIDAGLQSAHRMLYQESSKDGQIIGATVVVVAAVDDLLAVLWAGDSRAYLVRERTLYPLTRDHTQLEALIDQGEVRAEDASGHPAGRVVTRAVGATAELVLDLEIVRAKPLDRVLLCSDGLAKHVADEELAGFFGTDDAPDAITEALINTVLTRGAMDNISVIVLSAESVNGTSERAPTSPSPASI